MDPSPATSLVTVLPIRTLCLYVVLMAGPHSSLVIWAN
jgi:hypothetical protein